MSRTDPQINVRLSQALKDRLTEAAAAGGRSVNTEIVHRLERSFDPEPESDAAYQVLLETTVRIGRMQSIAENVGRWQQTGWRLFLKLAELAGDRVSSELREEMAQFRDMPIFEIEATSEPVKAKQPTKAK